MKLEPTDALIVVDVQRDFCPGGSLPVPRGDLVVPVLARAIGLFLEERLPVFLTRDWHPRDHASFRTRGGPWPVHCVAGTDGAAFHPDLPIPERAVVVSKGTAPDREAYSGFEGTELEDLLRSRGVRRILVGGLATDYCVKATVLDGRKAGFRAAVLLDAVRAVDVRPGDGDRALEEMVRSGAEEIRVDVEGSPRVPG